MKNFFLIISVCFTASTTLAETQEAWLAFGDIRGNIEPCGCSPESDFGGIQRLAKALTFESAQFKGVEKFNLGNVFDLDAKDAIKSAYLSKALNYIQPTASLLNTTEIKLLTKGQISEKTAKKHNYVMTNGSSDLFKRYSFVKPHITTANSIIFGVNLETEKSHHSLFITTDKAVKYIKKISDDNPRKNIKLLFSGSSQKLAVVLKSQKFDLILRSNLDPLDTIMHQKQKNNEALLQADVKDVITYFVPIGGQGYLRGGALLSTPTINLEGILSNNSPPKNCSGDSILSTSCDQARFVNWLSPQYNDGSPLKKLMDEYYHKKEAAFDLEIQERLKSATNHNFAGAEACKTCHIKEYTIWKKSRHAKAFSTLEKKGKSKIDDCVKCHVTKFEEQYHFISKEHTPQLINVQCENCHGPRKEHIKNPLIKLNFPNAKSICVGCHNAAHSPMFELNTYWKKIEH